MPISLGATRTLSIPIANSNFNAHDEDATFIEKRLPASAATVVNPKTGYPEASAGDAKPSKLRNFNLLLH